MALQRGIIVHMRLLHRRSTHQRSFALRLCLLGLLLIVAECQVSPAAPVNAAGIFGAPAFNLQWEQGEGIITNFWGPLVNASVPMYEEYAQSPPTGQRLVQYFDKGRMELNTPGGPVTNGLLTEELITGRVQMGDAQFMQRVPARIPVAGDPDNAFPLYADLRAFTGTPVTAPRIASTLAALGGINSAFPAATGDFNAQIVTYDALTGHYVPYAFGDFRNRFGLQTIGYAVTEPFWATLRVGTISKPVLIQAFERRVLTYTPSNSRNFQVEFGNIGQHYYKYRHAPGSSDNPPPLVPQPVPAIFQPVGP